MDASSATRVYHNTKLKMSMIRVVVKLVVIQNIIRRDKEKPKKKELIRQPPQNDVPQKAMCMWQIYSERTKSTPCRNRNPPEQYRKHFFGWEQSASQRTFDAQYTTNAAEIPLKNRCKFRFSREIVFRVGEPSALRRACTQPRHECPSTPAGIAGNGLVLPQSGRGTCSPCARADAQDS